MASGDSCLLVRGPNGELRVKHYDCDDYPDGTVTEFSGPNGDPVIVYSEDGN